MTTLTLLFIKSGRSPIRHPGDAPVQVLNLHPYEKMVPGTEVLVSNAMKCNRIFYSTVNSESIVSRILYHVPRANLRSSSAFHLPTARTNLLTASPFYQMIQNYHMYEERLDIFACSIHSIKALFV